MGTRDIGSIVSGSVGLLPTKTPFSTSCSPTPPRNRVSITSRGWLVVIFCFLVFFSPFFLSFPCFFPFLVIVHVFFYHFLSLHMRIFFFLACHFSCFVNYFLSLSTYTFFFCFIHSPLFPNSISHSSHSHSSVTIKNRKLCIFFHFFLATPAN